MNASRTSQRIIGALFVALLWLLAGTATPAHAQGPSTFTYQGYLTTASGPVTAVCDFRFALFGQESSGSQIGITISRSGVSVAQGVFSVQLLSSFADTFFNTPRYLQIEVKCPGDAAFVLLTPRQAITVAPYSNYAFNAGAAASATTATTATSATTASNVPWSGLTGTATAWLVNGNAGTNPSNRFLGTTDNQAFEVRVNNLRALRLEPKNDATLGQAPAIIAGSSFNVVGANAVGATIGGGGKSSTTLRNEVNAAFGTVSGGFDNVASGETSTVGGGSQNLANGEYSTISGGEGNTSSGGRSVIVGGASNTASGAWSSILGGTNNVATDWYAVVAGGSQNLASGKYTFAAGRQAEAIHEGAFVWSDSELTTTQSPGENTFTVAASGGIWLGDSASIVSIPAGRFLNTSTGGYLTTGGAWTNSSDRALKANFTSIDPHTILEAVSKLPITTWNYTAEGERIKHLGPTAQDFRAAFGLGMDDKSISTVDVSGVALAAIQGLNALVVNQQSQIDALREENRTLEARLSALETAVNRGFGLNSPIEMSLWSLVGAVVCLVGLGLLSAGITRALARRKQG